MRKTNEEFILELKQKNPEILAIGEYTGCKKKIMVQCKKCGNKWEAAPSNLLYGYGCPRCYGTPKKTNDIFVSEIKKIYPDVEVIDEYINAKTKIRVQCKICKNIWFSRPNNLLRGHRCPVCYGTPKKTNAQFLQQVNKLNSTIELVEDYRDCKTKIRVKCKICGCEWKCRPNDLIRQDGLNTGCPKCAGNERKDHDVFINEVRKTSPKIKVLGRYSGRRKRILVQCKTCQYQWEVEAASLLSGRMCPKCSAGYQSSYFEQCIYWALVNLFGEKNIIHRDKSMVGKELDIYIPHLKIAIEPGSWFWHKERLEQDIAKQKLCKEKGIKLVIIYDDVGEQIDFFKQNDFNILISEDIGVDRNNIELLERVLKQVFENIGINYNPSEEELRALREKAELAVRKKTTLDFSNELLSINPNIVVIGDYLGVHTKVQVKCKKCNYEWSSVPSNLLRKHGCPKCGKTLKKTHEEYVAELKTINPNISVLGEYSGAKKKIKVKCSICKFEWESLAGNLLAGHGCPKVRQHIY